MTPEFLHRRVNAIRELPSPFTPLANVAHKLVDAHINGEIPAEELNELFRLIEEHVENLQRVITEQQKNFALRVNLMQSIANLIE